MLPSMKISFMNLMRAFRVCIYPTSSEASCNDKCIYCIFDIIHQVSVEGNQAVIILHFLTKGFNFAFILNNHIHTLKPELQEQLGVRYLAQRHFHTWGGTKDLNLL